MLAGNLRETGKRIENVWRNGGENFEGIGSTLESFDVNPFMYEYVLEKAWESRLTDEQWIEALADRRYGSVNEQARAAWRELLDKVYTEYAHLGQGMLTNARPTLKGHGNWTTNPRIGYRNEDLFGIWKTLLKAGEGSSRDTYVFDVVNLGRQVLGNYFGCVRDEFAEAYDARDTLLLALKGHEMLEILSDLELLLSCHPTFSFGRWIRGAESFGRQADEKAYYKKNARTLLTTWGERGQSLNDYANRSWAGLMNGYYTPRWEMFVREVIKSLREGIPFDEKKFDGLMKDFEYDWVEHDFVSSDRAREDGCEIAAQLMEKYKARIEK